MRYYSVKECEYALKKLREYSEILKEQTKLTKKDIKFYEEKLIKAKHKESQPGFKYEEPDWMKYTKI